MILAFLCFLAIILCVLGLTELIFFLRLWALCPCTKANNYLTVALTKSDYYFQLVMAAEKLCWYGSGMFDGVIALTDGLSFEEITVCEKLNRDSYSSRIIFCTREELPEKIDYLNKQDE